VLIKEARERFSTVRHNLGYYRCVANTATYSIDHTLDNLPTLLENALAKVILRHPPLCCGLINEDKNDPSFVRLESVDVSKCIIYRTLHSSSPEEYKQGLIEIFEHQHQQLWPDLHCRPGWKLIFVQSKPLPAERTVFDAMFAYHHAIADGLSGMVFHRSMMGALNDPATVTMEDSIIKIPDSLILPPPLEDMVDFKVSWWYLLSTLWKEMRPKWLSTDSSPPWTGAICSPINIQKYESHVKLITLSANDVTTILAACKKQKTTLTGLLHGLIVASLASRVPSATSFTSMTPFSPRYLSGISSTNDIAAQVCGHSSRYNPEIISAIRASSNPSEIMDQIWKIARNFRAEMAAEMALMPNDNIIGMLPYIKNLHNLLLSRIGKPRGDTYEVSNVGSLKSEDMKGKWKIERIVFTQSGMATGPAFAFNVASVVGGPLTISVTWLEGEIEEKLVAEIIEDVQYALRLIAGGREVSLEYYD
jgi:hypothetical protein